MTPVVPPSDAYLRTEFLERIAHDLRGPVAVTSGALDEIELALGAGAEAHRTFFLMARRGMLRVLRIAERLRRTAQLEGGAVTWAKESTDLRDLTREVVKQTEELEARRSVRVTASFSEASCLVAVDPDWMKIALAELVGNAIRFGRSVVTVHTEPVAGEVRVTITDDGVGFIGPEVARFTPPAEKRGVGLSLALARDVVEAHGGRIEVAGPSTNGDPDSVVRVALYLPAEPAEL